MTNKDDLVEQCTRRSIDLEKEAASMKPGLSTAAISCLDRDEGFYDN